MKCLIKLYNSFKLLFRFSSKFIKIRFVFLISLQLVFFSCFSQTGCVKYYYPGFDPTPEYFPTSLGGANGTFGPRYGGTPLPFPAGCFPTEPIPYLLNSGECSLRNPANGAYNLRGLLVQRHIACPIDDYIIYLILIFGTLGFLLLKKKLLWN